MSDNQIERIMDTLNDIQKSQLDIRERLAIVETMLHERTDDTKELRNMIKSHEDRIAELESYKFSTVGAKEVIAFAIMAGLALWGVLK